MVKFLYILASIPLVSLALALVLLLIGPSTEDDDPGNTLRFDRLSQKTAETTGQQIKLEARDGEKLTLQHFAASSTTQSPMTLILLHGSGYQGAYLYPLADNLAKAGKAEVYVPNIRGHYLSGARRGDINYTNQLVDDITDIISHIRSNQPKARILLGGHSSGGGLAVRYAGSEGGKMVESYLLLAPYLGHDAPTVRKNSGGWARPALPRIIGLSMLNTVGFKGFNHLPTLTFNMPKAVRNGTETLSYSYRLMTGFAPHRDLKGDLENLPASSRVLVGAEDEAFVPGAYPPLFQAQSKARVHILPGLSHFEIANHPDVWAQSAQWLDGLAAH